MSDLLIDQMYFEPTFLSEVIHSLPHLSLSLETVDDTFNPGSFEYVLSLILIGSLPLSIILCGLKVLGVHMLQEWLSANKNTPPNRCNCLPQKILRKCAGLLCLIIFLEILLHLAILINIPLSILPETMNMRDFHMYQVKKVDSLTGSLELSKINFVDDYTEHHVHDMTLAYKKLAEAVVSAGVMVRQRQLAPREMMMPFGQYVALYEWFRFILFLMIWCTALGICLMLSQTGDGVGQTSAKCGIYAIIFCSVMSIAVTILMVGLADLCQDPSAGAAKLTPLETKQAFLKYQYNRMCISYRLALEESLRKFQLAVLTFRRQVLRQIEVDLMVFDPHFNAFETDLLWPKREKVSKGYSAWNVWSQLTQDQKKERFDTYHDKRLYGQAIYKYVDNFYKKMKNETWNDRMYCYDSDDEIEEFIDFKDDARQLCAGDRVLIWLVLQIFAILILAALFFYIVRFHISNMRFGQRVPE